MYKIQLQPILTHVQELQAMGFSVHFPVKCLPHKDFLKRLSAHVDGFDVSNDTELELIRNLKPRLSVSSPALEKINSRKVLSAKKSIFCIQSQSQLRHAKVSNPFMVRLNPYPSGNSALPSRFGFSINSPSPDLVRTMKKKSFFGLATHFGLPDNRSEYVVRYLAAAKRFCLKHQLDPRVMNLGGGWLGFGEADYRFIAETAKNLFPRAELILESGAEVTRKGITLKSKVIDVQESEDDVFLTVDISIEAHLRWSRPKINFGYADFQRIGTGRRFWICGSTCSETDRLGPFFQNTHSPPKSYIGKQLIFTDLLGYSIAWNTGFNGRPALKVRVVS